MRRKTRIMGHEDGAKSSLSSFLLMLSSLLHHLRPSPSHFPMNTLINERQFALIDHEKSITVIKLAVIINELKSIQFEIHKEFIAQHFIK